MPTTLRPSRTKPPAAKRNAGSGDPGTPVALIAVDSAAVPERADRAVQRWLVACALAVVLAVAAGGITRLTGSGLSITEWKPVSGVLPPLSDAEWTNAYERYLAVPEAQTVHRGITVDEFRRLFWWEWTHRLVARAVGLLLALPFFVLLLRRRIRPDMRLRLMNLPLLAALQGGMGWYMVQSGLSGRTSVSPYRLVAHLGVALVIFAIAVWTASELARQPRRSSGTTRSQRGRSVVPILLAALVFVTILSGGFVAGLGAGRIFNTFPLMDGRLVPPGYSAIEGWRNAFENPIAVQFHHRLLAIGTVMLVWSASIVAWARAWPRALQQGLALTSGVAAAQAALGILTLLLAVPVVAAVVHQVVALILLASLLVIAQRGRG